MSGHSKWKNIMHKKEKADAAKAKIFTKIGKEMAVAIKAGGPDPNVNSRLRDLIAKAKANNVPNDNIERIIKKASGEGNSANYSFHVPHDVKGMIECFGGDKTFIERLDKLFAEPLDKKYYADQLFKVPISRSVRLSEAPGYGEPICYHDPYGKGSLEYAAVAKELMLRIEAIMKRVSKKSVEETEKKPNVIVELDGGGLRADITARLVYVDGERVEMSPKEYDLFFYMLRNKNIALSREKLLSEVWGYDFYGDARTLDTHIKLLRKSLGQYSRFIVTLRGVGYRFEA